MYIYGISEVPLELVCVYYNYKNINVFKLLRSSQWKSVISILHRMSNIAWLLNVAN